MRGKYSFAHSFMESHLKKTGNLLSKLDYKLFGFSLFIVVAIVLCFYFFVGLKSEKKIAQIDVFSLIPAKDAKAILQINEFDNFVLSCKKLQPAASLNDNLFRWLHVLDNIIYPLSKNTGTSFVAGTNPFYVSFHEYGEIFYAKLQQQKMHLWKKELENAIFPDFPPVIQQYKGTEIRHYTMPDSQFFSCVMHEGVFAGSFQSKALQQVIDTWNGDASISQDADINQLLRHEGKKIVANLLYYVNTAENLFVYDKTDNQEIQPLSGWSSADITFESERNEVWFSGYFKLKDTSDITISEYQPVNLFFPGDLMPPQTLFVKAISTKKTTENNDSSALKNAANGLYTVYLKDSTTTSVLKTYCLKLEDQVTFEKELTQFLHEHYPYSAFAKPLLVNTEMFNSFVVQNGDILNEIIERPVFAAGKTYHVAFFKGFMFISDNELDLTTYLKLLLNPNWIKRSLKEGKNDLSIVSMQGDIQQIVEASDSTLYLSKDTMPYLVLFSRWNIGIQYIKEEKLFLFHLVLANNR